MQLYKSYPFHYSNFFLDNLAHILLLHSFHFNFVVSEKVCQFCVPRAHMGPSDFN